MAEKRCEKEDMPVKGVAADKPLEECGCGCHGTWGGDAECWLKCKQCGALTELGQHCEDS